MRIEKRENIKEKRLFGTFDRPKMDGRTNLILYGGVFFAYAALLLLFCTKNSPFFAYQSWTDPNIYMDVGRAVCRGSVLYREVFDHKGPLLLLLFSVLARISPHSMHSLYLMQCITLGGSLLYLFRTARLFVSEKASFWICLIFPFFLLNAYTYSEGGGSAEELLLPCFMGSMFYLLRIFVTQKEATPNCDMYRTRDSFLLGLFAGTVLLVKINLTAFVGVGFGMWLLFLVFRKEWKAFFQALWRFMAGIFIAALPCLVYFTATHSFQDFWEVYIRFNLLYAVPSSNTEGKVTLFAALGTAILLNLLSVLLILLGVVGIALKRNAISSFGRTTYILTLAALLIATYIPGRSYQYLFMPILCFVGVGEIGAYFLVQRIVRKWLPRLSALRIRSAVAAAIALVLSVLIIASNTLYKEMALFHTEKDGVEIISETILSTWKPEKHEEKPNILLFNSEDIGFFGLTDCIPKLRVFYMPVINFTSYPDLIMAQYNYVADGLPDYVVCINYDESSEFDLSSINPDYRMIDKQISHNENTEIYITLYIKSKES
jgi:uncharacterized membrane protein